MRAWWPIRVAALTRNGGKPQVKILVLPDLHCYPRTYNKDLPNGQASRLAEWEQAADAIVALVEERQPRLAIVPGDLFRTPLPSPEEVLAVASLLMRIEKKGCKVLGIPGNHDKPAGNLKPTPNQVVARIGGADWRPEWAIATPQVWEGVLLNSSEQCTVACLPFVRANSIMAEAHDPAEAAQQVAANLVAVARGLRLQMKANGPKILVGHWSLTGALLPSNDTLPLTEPIIPTHELLAMGFDVIAFGHIHRAQTLNEWPWVGYAGSLLRGDFGEEGQPRGCWLIDTDLHTHEWCPVPAMEFVTLRADLRDAVGAQTFADSLAMPGDTCPDYQGAIVRVKYTATQDAAKTLDHTAVKACLEANGAAFVGGIQAEVERATRTRDSNLDETVTPSAALDMWLKVRNVPEERQQKVRVAFEQLRAKEVAE
jgi:DNA repair exonuclease SbcCD nuclease subunit